MRTSLQNIMSYYFKVRLENLTSVIVGYEKYSSEVLKFKKESVSFGLRKYTSE